MTADSAEQAAAFSAGLPARSLAAWVLVHNNRPGCSVDWLSRRLGIAQSGAVRILNRLVGAGLACRDQQSGRREIGLHPTAAGVQCLDRALRARAEATQELLCPLSLKEQEQMANVASKALRRAERQRGDADVVCRLCRLCDWAACGPGCPVDASVSSARGP